MTIDRTELRKKIPQGYCDVIAKKAGVSRVSVSGYFSGRSNSRKIEIAALQVVAELEKETSNLISQING